LRRKTLGDDPAQSKEFDRPVLSHADVLRVRVADGDGEDVGFFDRAGRSGVGRLTGLGGAGRAGRVGSLDDDHQVDAFFLGRFGAQRRGLVGRPARVEFRGGGCFFDRDFVHGGVRLVARWRGVCPVGSAANLAVACGTAAGGIPIG